MGATIYNKAFAVQLSHDFYNYVGAAAANKFKINGALELTPTIECAELLRNARMRFVRTASGFTVFYQAYKNPANALQALVALTAETEFVFAISLRTDAMALLSNVSNFNAAPKTYSAGKLLLLDQTVDGATPASPTTVNLQASLANMLKPAVFSYTFKSSDALYTGDADIVVKAGATTVFSVEDVPYNAITKTYTVEIDLKNQPKGFYTFTAYKANSVAPADIINETDFYMDGDLAMKNTFGVIRVKYNTAQIARLYDSTTGPNKFITFNHAFAARSTYWRYYVVPQTINTGTYDLGIVDGSSTYTFHATNPGSQVYGQPDTAITINGLNPVVMKSTIKIPFSEKVLTQLTLNKKAGMSPPEEVSAGLSNALFTGVDSDRLGAVAVTPTFTADISEIFVIV